MRIAINGDRLRTVLPGGPEIYTLNIILALGKVDTQNEYTIFLSGVPPKKILDQLNQLPPSFKTKIIPKILSWTQISLALALWSEKYDILFSAVHTLPFVALSRVKTVSMIHGLEFLTNQEKPKFPKNLTLGLPEKLTCKFSNVIVTPSNATKEAILNTKWNLRNADIKVIPEGVSEMFRKSSLEQVKTALEKHKIPHEPYLIFISTIQPRKNLKSIVEALAILKQKYGTKINLVVCGKLGWNYKEEVESPIKFGVGDQVFFAGRVPDTDLVALLSGAETFVTASYDEGFGLPVLEAMACGIPVIASDIPAHKTLAEDLAIYIDPYSPKNIAQKINSSLKENPELTNGRVEKAKERAGNFSWEESAKKLVEIFNVSNIK